MLRDLQFAAKVRSYVLLDFFKWKSLWIKVRVEIANNKEYVIFSKGISSSMRDFIILFFYFEVFNVKFS